MLCQQPGRGVEWTRDLFTGAGNLWAEANAAGLVSGFMLGNGTKSCHWYIIYSIATTQPDPAQTR